MKLPREFNIQEIAHVVGGKVQGPPDTKVSAVAMSPLRAQPGDIAFVFDAKLLARLSECQASIVVVPTGTDCKLPCIYVERPMVAIQKVLQAVQPKRYLPERGVHPSAVVDPSAELGADVAIGPFVVIGPLTKVGARTVIMAGSVIGGQVKVGEDCHFWPGVLVADYVQIGNRVVLQQGAVLGSDGFSYVTERISNMERRIAGDFNLVKESNPHLKVPQIGTVILEDDVEIGSCATIDRATMAATTIGRGTKIDNLVMVAHNCRIGQEALIVAHAAIAGSCVVGDRAIIAGQAGLVDHVSIADDVIVQGQAGVMKDLPEGAVVGGSPAVPAREFMTTAAMNRRMPKMQHDLRALKKRVEELEAALNERATVAR